MSVFKPKPAYQIKEPREWNESDKRWVAHYIELYNYYDNEVRQRITWREEAERLQNENVFLHKTINEVD